MREVKIIKGVYGHRPAGTHRIRPIMAGDTVYVPDTEADRLVCIGVAEMIPQAAEPACEGVATPQEGQAEGEHGIGKDAETLFGEAQAEGGTASTLDPEQLKALTNAKLRELAEAMGISTARLKNKAELIDAITSVQVIPGPEEESVEDGEQPPTLCAEAPVV